MKVTISGIEDVNRVLQEIAPREARNILRATVNDIAKEAAARARAYSPNDTGRMDDLTKHRREKGTRNKVVSAVVVGRSAFYWRFLEYGTGPDRVEHAMFLKALRSMSADLDALYLTTFVRKLEARLARVRASGG